MMGNLLKVPARWHLNPGDLLAVPVEHGQASKEVPPLPGRRFNLIEVLIAWVWLPVNWVLEARVVGIQVGPIDQHLLQG